MTMHLSLYILLTVTPFISTEYVINPDIVIKNVDRNIDISSQIVKIQYKYTVTNIGDTIIKSLAIATDGALKQHIAYISAQSGEMLKTPLTVSEIKTIKKPLVSGGKVLWKVRRRLILFSQFLP